MLEDEKNAVTRSQKFRSSTTIDPKPSVQRMTSDSVVLCRTEECFLHGFKRGFRSEVRVSGRDQGEGEEGVREGGGGRGV